MCKASFQGHRSMSSKLVAGNECEYIEEFPIRLVCAAEFVIGSRRQCIQEIPVAPTCPTGTLRGPSGRCERSVAKRPVCDSGEELVGSRCRHTSFFASELLCEIGFDLLYDKCKKVTFENPVPRCSSGILKANRCVTERSSVPLLQCPSGYRLAKGPKCIKEVLSDYSRIVV